MVIILIEDRYSMDTNSKQETRNLETRLKFIQEIFSNKFPSEQILASCIKYKLNTSLQQYKFDLHLSALDLANTDPVKVLSKLNKEI